MIIVAAFHLWKEDINTVRLMKSLSQILTNNYWHRQEFLIELATEIPLVKKMLSMMELLFKIIKFRQTLF